MESTVTASNCFVAVLLDVIARVRTTEEKLIHCCSALRLVCQLV